LALVLGLGTWPWYLALVLALQLAFFISCVM
jgi:hypothetical protein